jgi:hypothetical protein
MGKIGTVFWYQIWAIHRKELQNKITVILVEPVHTDDVLVKHGLRETLIRKGQVNIQRARKSQEVILEAAVTKDDDMEAPMKLAILKNDQPTLKFQLYRMIRRRLSSAMSGALIENVMPI